MREFQLIYFLLLLIFFMFLVVLFMTTIHRDSQLLSLWIKSARAVIHLRIGSCLAWTYRVMNTRVQFGERRVRLARGVAESKSS